MQGNFDQNYSSYLNSLTPIYNSASNLANIDIAKSNDLTEGLQAGFQIRNPKAFAKPKEKRKSNGMAGIGTITGSVIGGLVGGPTGAAAGAEVGATAEGIFNA